MDGRLSHSVGHSTETENDRVAAHRSQMGFPHGHQTNSGKLLYTLLVYGTDLLFGSPTCTPWGGHARSWDENNRAEQRQAQGRTLDFLCAACAIQLCLGRHFVLENPHGSDIWTESALRHLTAIIHKTVLDQCQFDTQMDGKPVKKTTDLFSDCPLPQLSRRCDGTHEHTVLQGHNEHGSRTAQAAVYSDRLCTAFLDQFHTLQSHSEGGRVRLNFDSLSGP